MQTNKSPLSRTPGDQPPHLRFVPCLLFRRLVLEQKKTKTALRAYPLVNAPRGVTEKKTKRAGFGVYFLVAPKSKLELKSKF